MSYLTEQNDWDYLLILKPLALFSVTWILMCKCIRINCIDFINDEISCHFNSTSKENGHLKKSAVSYFKIRTIEIILIIELCVNMRLLNVITTFGKSV